MFHSRSLLNVLMVRCVLWVERIHQITRSHHQIFPHAGCQHSMATGVLLLNSPSPSVRRLCAKSQPLHLGAHVLQNPPRNPVVGSTPGRPTVARACTALTSKGLVCPPGAGPETFRHGLGSAEEGGNGLGMAVGWG